MSSLFATTILGPSIDPETKIILVLSLASLPFFVWFSGRSVCRLTGGTRHNAKADVLILAICLVGFPLCVCAAYIHALEIYRMLPLESYRDKEAKYQYVAHKKLGELIARSHPGGTILIIKYGDWSYGTDGEPSQIFQAIDKGLADGLADKAQVVAVETVDTGPAMEYIWEETNPDAEELEALMLTADKFDAFWEKHSDCTVVVSLAGLPAHHTKMTFWKTLDPVKGPVLYLNNSAVEELYEPIADGRIKGIVVDKPVPVDINPHVPESAEEAFNMRYVLITPENVASVLTPTGNVIIPPNKPVEEKHFSGMITCVAWASIPAFYAGLILLAVARIVSNRRNKASMDSE